MKTVRRRKSGMSVGRLQRRQLEKQMASALTHGCECGVCGDTMTAPTKPLLQARLQDHFRKVHPALPPPQLDRLAGLLCVDCHQPIPNVELADTSAKAVFATQGTAFRCPTCAARRQAEAEIVMLREVLRKNYRWWRVQGWWQPTDRGLQLGPVMASLSIERGRWRPSLTLLGRWLMWPRPTAERQP